MVEVEPVETTNLDGYGFPPLPWSRAQDLLAVGSPGPEVPMFLGTIRPDGRPHAAGIGAVWLDGEMYFTSSPAARKAKNLARNNACTISMRLDGLDLVLEGEAARVTDPETLQKVVAVYNKHWPARVEGDAVTAPFNAPSAGPPPWHVYRFKFHSAFGVAFKEPYGATRWRFGV